MTGYTSAVVKNPTGNLTQLSLDDPGSWPPGLTDPTRLLLEYWRSKRLGDRFPRRAAIEPRDLVEILPYLLIIDRLDGAESDYRFRLVGTRIAEIEGDCTGRLLSELFPDRRRHARIWRHYDEACAGLVQRRNENLGWLGKSWIGYEVVLLPLLDAGGAVGHLIGTAHGEPLRRAPDASRPAPRVRPDHALPAVSLGADGIVTVDYATGAVAVSAATVRYTRRRIRELGGGRPVPVLVLAEAASGFGGELQAALAEPEHAVAVRAAAIVARSRGGREMAALFLEGDRPPFPVRLFGSADEARGWLRGFL